jgi:hypothetical protein
VRADEAKVGELARDLEDEHRTIAQLKEQVWVCDALEMVECECTKRGSDRAAPTHPPSLSLCSHPLFTCIAL